MSSVLGLILSGLQAVFHSTSSGVGGLIVGGVHGVFEWILTAVATWLAELPLLTAETSASWNIPPKAPHPRGTGQDWAGGV